ncbi:MAG: DUF427 domain-containing protein [Alphaproteobacteria bacterium]
MTNIDVAAPGFQTHADHRIKLTPAPGTWRAVHGGQTLAQSDKVLVMREGSYDPVHYFPGNALQAGHLTPSDHTSYCPFKGEASYWSLSDTGKLVENLAWGYLDPYREMAQIKGYVAFYTDRVEVAQV